MQSVSLTQHVCPVLSVCVGLGGGAWWVSTASLKILLNSELLGEGGGYSDIQQAHNEECLLWRGVWELWFV